MKNKPDEKQRLSFDDLISTMSKGDLAELGVGDVAYTKRYVINGQTAFVLHAADGTAIAVQNSESAAQQSAHHQDLELVTVH